mmetsp:Transcript_20400/g.36532  ORF Transcript_20400/g.36532 Transcript_20400/m.36532 type:complete len:124 (-) Transcript_20400:127-498(-)|eukprot:CAMPEP_0197628100 /NCGR_PEP_ID=MMETSP1338-20131121/6521_1 /TAXON_ID=43686 ORGANISM="Pelagodinium beii, Strain RCC1491" /NCGR_SAMPLE_ID=MMETSP1338 /ASSEMBLY_ACC=CAM_ASM_000754 /LENGTH=123 /DNA_ID=CAMNT_0043199003 /DNA_START=27 /DNA_END=398 /DNA_ORIENTATION=-
MAKRRTSLVVPPPAGQLPPAKKQKQGKDKPAGSSSKKQVAKKDAKKGKNPKKERKPLSAAKEAKLVGELIEGQPGVAAPHPMPLSALTKHKDVAWQWMEGGKMKYPIPIGSSRPLSPFRSDED